MLDEKAYHRSRWVTLEWAEGEHVPKNVVERNEQKFMPNQSANITTTRKKTAPKDHGDNSLAVKFPSVAAEWDYTAAVNEGLNPSQITPGSGKNIGWVCSKADCGHKWKTRVCHRTNKTRPSGCPECSKRRLVPKEDSLAVRNPTVAAEWDYAAAVNEGLTPSQITPRRGKKQAWVCSKADCGHKWEIQVAHRTRKVNPSGCPECSKRRLIPKEDSLAVRNPTVAAEWDYAAAVNEGLTPSQIIPGSGKKQAWVCSKADCGHKWETRVYDRTRKVRSSGCPECSKRRLIPKEDSLATKNPTVAAEWDYTAAVNEGLNPSQITPRRGKKQAWVCSKADCGHKWETTVCSRTNKTRSSGCPACAGKVILPGVNDLATKDPTVAAEWDYAAAVNEGLTPSQIMPGSGKNIGWVCSKADCGHKWETQVSNRTKKTYPTGCPECSKQRLVPKEDSLAAKNPTVAAEWDYTAAVNEGLTPSLITPGSDKKRGWVCSKADCGHKWETRVSNRTRKVRPTGCPACAFGASRSSGEAALAGYVESLLPANLNVSHSVRTVLDGQEIDIYIEGLGLGIEYNGTFFHSEAKVEASYHESKFLKAKANDIRLIQIWEDEYVPGESVPTHRRSEANRKMKATESLLANLISTSMDGFDDSYSDSWWFDDNHSVEELKRFMDAQTTEGFVSSFNHSVVLRNDESHACAVMTLNIDKENRIAEVVQYASSYPTVQAYSSMIQHVKFIHSNLMAVNAHMDNCFPADDIYVNAGFIETEHVSASFKYTKDKQRFNVTEDSEKKYETDSNLHRIWDAGKTLWVKTF